MSITNSMLDLIKINPAVLAPAPLADLDAAIIRRRKDEVHHCIRCPRRACVAYVAHLDDGNRWIDLCWKCDYWLRTEMAETAEAEEPTTQHLRLR